MHACHSPRALLPAGFGWFTALCNSYTLEMGILELLSWFPCPTLLELLSSAYPSSYIVHCSRYQVLGGSGTAYSKVAHIPGSWAGATPFPWKYILCAFSMLNWPRGKLQVTTLMKTWKKMEVMMADIIGGVEFVLLIQAAKLILQILIVFSESTYSYK